MKYVIFQYTYTYYYQNYNKKYQLNNILSKNLNVKIM